MQYAPRYRFALTLAVLLPLALVLLCAPVFGEQPYVGKFDAYIGYAYLNSSKIGLSENGFHLQVGTNPRMWYSLGFDYSRATGKMVLLPDMLPTSLQQTLGAQLAQLAAAGRLPAGYKLAVGTDSTTETFAAGPQLSYRRLASVTFFVRPSVGAIHERAVPLTSAADPIAKGIINQLAPSGQKTDWTPFYGFGAGFDLNVHKHFGLRFQADFVRDHLFDDLLRESRNTIRFSLGPCIRFGRNIAE